MFIVPAEILELNTGEWHVEERNGGAENSEVHG